MADQEKNEYLMAFTQTELKPIQTTKPNFHFAYRFLTPNQYGIYYGLTEGSAKAFVADLVPADQRGTAYGLYNAAVGIVALPASLLAGFLWQGIGRWQGFGPSAPLVFGSILAVGAAILLLLFVPENAASWTR